MPAGLSPHQSEPPAAAGTHADSTAHGPCGSALPFRDPHPTPATERCLEAFTPSRYACLERGVCLARRLPHAPELLWNLKINRGTPEGTQTRLL